MTEMNIDQFFSNLPNYFLPEKAVGLNTSIQVVLTGDKGRGVAKIRDQKCTVEKCTMENPALTITADASDFYAIFKGNGRHPCVYDGENCESRETWGWQCV